MTVEALGITLAEPEMFGIGDRRGTAVSVEEFLRQQRQGRQDYSSRQVQSVVDTVHAASVALSSYQVLSPPKIEFLRRPVEHFTLSYCIAGYHPDLGKRNNRALTPEETIVHYSIFPPDH